MARPEEAEGGLSVALELDLSLWWKTELEQGR